jgi:hypothetical protein
MKWLILLAVLLIIPFTSAITTDLKQEYLPGETIIIKISGNILQPIYPADIIFKRNHVDVAISYDIKRFGQDYYLYAQAPIKSNNYTIFINDIDTTVNGIQTTIDFNQTFKVAGNLTEYSINPGLAIITEDSVSFTINSNLDQPVNINYNFSEENSITLNPGSNTLNLQVSSKDNGIYFAQIGKYNIPIQIIKTITPNITFQKNLLIFPHFLNRTILENSNFSFNLTLTNNGTSSLNNIRFSFDNSDILFSKDKIQTLQSVESATLTISLSRFSGNDVVGSIIIFDDLEQLGNVSLGISFTTDENQTTSINESISQFYCSELQGLFCTTEEICSGEQVQALDGLCCKGQCSVEKSSGFGWIAYTAIGLVILVLIIVFLRYNKAGKVPQIKPTPINPLLKKV